MDRRIEPLADAIDVREEFVLAPDDELRGGRRRRRAQVGDEVGDGEIGFVADAGDHRHRRCDDRARQDLLVERPQILERAAAARHDDHVDGFDARDLANRVRDFAPGAFALHARRRNHEMRIRIAAAEDANDVAQAPRRRAT